MSENEYFLDSRMCWMASWTAGSMPWLMPLIRADSFIGIRTMMGKFSPSLANQLLSCPCLVRSLHTLARAGWNSKTERSRHPVGRSISQPLQSLRAGAMLPCRVTRWDPAVLSLSHCLGIANPGSSGMLRRPPVKETVFRNRADAKAATAPAVGELVLCGLWLQTEKYFYSVTVPPVWEYSKDAETGVAEGELSPLGVRHPNDLLSNSPLIQRLCSPLISSTSLTQAQECPEEWPQNHGDYLPRCRHRSITRWQLLRIQNHLRSKFPAKRCQLRASLPNAAAKSDKLRRRDGEKRLKTHRAGWQWTLGRRGPTGRCRLSLPWQPMGLRCASPMVRQTSAEATAAAAAAAHRARKREHWMWRRRGSEGGMGEGRGIQQPGGKAA